MWTFLNVWLLGYIVAKLFLKQTQSKNIFLTFNI